MYDPNMMNQGAFGANRAGMGWRASRREQQGQLANQQNRMGNMQDRMYNLQEQYKGAGSDQHAGIQGRMDRLQGRMDRLQGNMGDPNATGANRAGMGWRQERRQAKRDGSYDPNAQGGYGIGGLGAWGFSQGGGMSEEDMRNAKPMPMPMPMLPGGREPGRITGGFNPWGGMFGGMQGGYPPMGGMREMINWTNGGPPMGGMPQQGAQRPTPAAPYNPSAPPATPQMGGWNPLTTPTSMGNMFETQWGRLVPSSTGNQNVFQREGDPSMYFHYDPSAQDGVGAMGGWKSMSPEAYAGYGDYAYKDPRQFGAAANPMMQQWTRGPGGFIQGMVGTGAYA